MAGEAVDLLLEFIPCILKPCQKNFSHLFALFEVKMIPAKEKKVNKKLNFSNFYQTQATTKFIFSNDELCWLSIIRDTLIF